MAGEVEQITDLEGKAIQGWKAHPAAAIMPYVNKTNLRDLAEDIKANGLEHPVVVDADGLVLDGRNRVRAWKAAGFAMKDLPTVKYTGSTEGAAVEKYVFSANMARRHLNKQERIRLRLKLLDAIGEKEPEAVTAAETGASVHSVRKTKEGLKKGKTASKGGGRPKGGGPPQRITLDREELGPAGLAKLVIEKWADVPRNLVQSFIDQLTKQWDEYQAKAEAEAAKGDDEGDDVAA